MLAEPATRRLELFVEPADHVHPFTVHPFTTNANKLGILVAAADSHEQVEAAGEAPSAAPLG